ncbi:hypothetical protein BST92_11605 [Nonlabens arenilitoris]|uniref:Secretion system C-terminal sorting domain-containing protein n=2 Tax=Nonlabens arenilitoris TaxID=1217969 RepID=A0A2S7UD66_9FLAO|nr:hypothetical protein BST92_11605 [Nonlabens arenilitoris]
MKTMKNLIIIALMLTTLTGYAAKLTNTVPAKNVTTVKFNNVKKGQLLTIKDATEVTLYSETIQLNGNYKQQFDLTTLENGTYRIELNKDSQVLIQQFNVNNGIVSFSTENVFYKPVAVQKNNQILISQLVSSDEVLDVQIYYNDNLIHEDEISDAAVLSRIYQLSSDKKGEYFIVMKSAGKTFYKSITI